MFTGLIKDLGKIVNIKKDTKNIARYLTLQTNINTADIKIGDSIACNGICLTVMKNGIVKNENYFNFFQVFLSTETISKTNAASWKVDDYVNLEPSLRAESLIGGHYVSGHIDAVTYVKSVRQIEQAKEVTIATNKHIEPFIATKGSVALDGISFTVNKVIKDAFVVMVIPHTSKVTNWEKISQKQKVNLEVDMIARYVVRHAEFYQNINITPEK